MDVSPDVIYFLILGSHVIFPPPIFMWLHMCRYNVIMKAMLYEIEEFNNKPACASGMPAAAVSALKERQTPQLSASEPFDLDTPLVL